MTYKNESMFQSVHLYTQTMMQMMRERETARVREIKNAPTCHQYVDACRLPSIHEETSYTVDCFTVKKIR